MNNNSQSIHIKRDILIRLVKAFDSNNFEKNTAKIPFEMRPKGAEVPYRCCIHKERDVIRHRIIADLGLSMETFDERALISDYAKQAKERKEVEKEVLTVLESACQGCVPSRMFVTDLCQGCVARPCVESCKFVYFQKGFLYRFQFFYLEFHFVIFQYLQHDVFVIEL